MITLQLQVWQCASIPSDWNPFDDQHYELWWTVDNFEAGQGHGGAVKAGRRRRAGCSAIKCR